MREKKEGPTKNGRFKGKKRTSWPLLVGLVLVTLLAAVSCSVAGEQRGEPVEDEPQTPTDRAQVETEEPQAGVDLGHPSLGQKNAPVLMIEYADYQ